MKTIVLKLDKNEPNTESLKRAVDVLKSGGLVIFPSDTVYGIAANAFISTAREQIYKLKGRSFDKPLILMADNIGSLRAVVDIHEKAEKIAEQFWPGPLTLICHTTNLGKMVMGGRHNCGARIPKDKTLLKLLKLCSFPLATTSANPSSKPSAKSGKEAGKYFDGKVDVILDAGKTTLGKESTVIDATHFPFVVLREGCLHKSELLKYI